MEQLIELLTQIQELAGVGIEALEEALGAGGGGDAPPEGPPPGEAGLPPEEAGSPPEAGAPPVG